MSVLAYEIDPNLVEPLQATLAEAGALASELGRRLDVTVCETNFVLRPPAPCAGNVLLMNPPYKKLGVASDERVALISGEQPSESRICMRRSWCAQYEL
jgi:predicted RNA methylase